MVINVKISLCKITRASKLFQRNYYLPLLKPLSPKDALRRKIITGQNVLGARVEHYIPVLENHEERVARRKKNSRGPIIKKRVKISERWKYVIPFFDDDMEYHNLLRGIVSRKPKGKGQHYAYEVFDKNCMLVVPHQFEKAIRDKDIIDVTMAQRSEKVVLKLNNNVRVTLPLAKFEANVPVYRGSGWTKELVEEAHHHGKETFSLAKIFEAKEQGVEEWELEMMRLANKRKKKIKGEDTGDWKEMLSGCLDNMDWDKFEEDTKQILEEKDEIVEEEDIPMAVDNMEKTMHVCEKLKEGGEEVLSQLPVMKEVPEVIRILESGEMCELQNVSGVRVHLEAGKSCFIAGQMVKGDDNEVFVPGQTVTNDAGTSEYTPGITVYLENEPTLIPGLVMGEDTQKAMFLPGESTITEGGQLQFEATEDDLPPREPSSSPPSSRSSSSSPSPPPTPKVRKPPQEIVIKRRNFDEEKEPVVRKERIKKRAPVQMSNTRDRSPSKLSFRPQRQPLDDTLTLLEERRRERDKEDLKRLKDRLEEKKRKEETKVDQLRLQMRQKYKNLKFEQPPPYQPGEPVKKSKQLEELEESIVKGTFFEDEQTKKIMENMRNNAKRMSRFKNNFDFRAGGDSLYSGFSRTYRVH